VVRLRKLIPRSSLRTLAIFLLLVTSAGWLWWHWEPWSEREEREAHEITASWMTSGLDETTRTRGPLGLLEAQVYNAAADGFLRKLRARKTTYCMDVSGDGERVAVGKYGVHERGTTPRILETRTGREIAFLAGHDGLVQAVRFFPEGTRVITCASDNTARIWDSRTGQCLAVFHGIGGPARGPLISPDGMQVAMHYVTFVCIYRRRPE